MVRTVVAIAYMAVWGIATVIILIKNGTVPPEYWTLPAFGLGGLLAALNAQDKRNSKSTKLPPPAGEDDDDIVKESP